MNTYKGYLQSKDDGSRIPLSVQAAPAEALSKTLAAFAATVLFEHSPVIPCNWDLRIDRDDVLAFEFSPAVESWIEV